MHFARVGKYLPLMLLLIPAAVQAKPKWKTVHTGNGLSVALDTASIASNTDGSYSVWTRWDYTRPRLLENKRSYSRLVEKAELKCSPIVLKRVSTAVYDSKGIILKERPGEPTEVDNSEVNSMTWDAPKRGSDGEHVWAAVCRTILARKTR